MVRKDTSYNFGLKLITAFFVTQCMTYPENNVSCALEKNIYSGTVGWHALYMSVRSILSIMCCLLINVLSG